MKDTEQKEVLASVIESLSALTANQAIIIELLHQALPGLSEAERDTVTKCATNNYEIAEKLQSARTVLLGDS